MFEQNIGEQQILNVPCSLENRIITDNSDEMDLYHVIIPHNGFTNLYNIAKR